MVDDIICFKFLHSILKLFENNSQIIIIAVIYAKYLEI